MEERRGGPRWSGHRPALVQLLRQPADEGWWKVGLIYLNGTYRMYARHHGGQLAQGPPKELPVLSRARPDSTQQP